MRLGRSAEGADWIKKKASGLLLFEDIQTRMVMHYTDTSSTLLRRRPAVPDSAPACA